MESIDLNSDLGESYGAWRMGDDAAMLEVVSSANVACGFHAGDPAGILRTVKAAAERSVAIGAHVSYPDLAGFGRRDMDISPADLTADVVYQIGALSGLAAAVGAEVRYVKPHGALYNRIAVDAVQGAAVIAALKAVDPTLVLMGLAGAPILHDGSPVPNRKWELISREAGVVRGQDWARRLDFYAASKRARAVRAWLLLRGCAHGRGGSGLAPFVRRRARACVAAVSRR